MRALPLLLLSLVLAPTGRLTSATATGPGPGPGPGLDSGPGPGPGSSRCQKSLDETAHIFGGLLPSPLPANSSTRNCFTTRSSPHLHKISTANPQNVAQYEVETENYSDFCFPSILVAGFPKCGTSFLFHALSQHPHILPTKRKELCLGGPLSETWPKLVSYLPSVLDTESSGGQRVMSGCLHLGSNIKAVKELCLPPSNMKVIFLVRDVADMLWAAYNYWCNVATDGPSCFPGKHTQPGQDVRTPQLFHARIKEGLPMGGGYSLNSKGNCYKKDIQMAVRVFGPKNVLVIKSEDILNDERKPEVLQKLVEFLELDIDNELRLASDKWLKDQVKSRYIINSGSAKSSKGVHQKVDISDTTFRKGLYEASNYLPMLPESRLWINHYWKKECRYLKSKFGIDYSIC